MRVIVPLLRLRALVATHGRALALVLVVVGLVAGGAAGWQATDSPHDTVTDSTVVQRVDARVDTGAVVTGESSLYERGTRIENASVYLVDAAPELTLRGRAVGPPDEPATVSQRLVVTTEAVRGDEVFWHGNRTIAHQRTDATNGTATLSGTLDVPGLQGNLDALRAELGDAGTLRVRVVHVVTYRTNGHEQTLANSAPLRVSGDSYAVEGSLATHDEVTTEETNREVASTGLLSTTFAGVRVGLDGPVLAATVLGLVAWVGACLSLRYGPRIDAAGARRRMLAARHDEWISTGALPPTVDRSLVGLASLVDLVDVAIDTNKRVIHDREQGLYAVLDGEYVYYYTVDGFIPGRDASPEDGERLLSR